MPQKKIQVIEYQCERCSHSWIPRKAEKPVICPKCKSPYWDRKKNGLQNRQ